MEEGLDVLDWVLLRTCLRQLRTGGDAAKGGFWQRARRECGTMPGQDYTCSVFRQSRLIQRDFYQVSRDSTVQVYRLVARMSLVLAQRPSLVLAAFAPEHGFALLMRLLDAGGMPPDTFLSRLSPGVRRSVWLLCGIVWLGAVSQGRNTWQVLAWMERCVCGWQTTLPRVLLVHEILVACTN